jgi:HAE1 family hydrophobic/amphiphilic exporter-1
VRTMVAGDTQATTYREGDDRYDVQLRVKDEFRNSPYALQRLMVPSGNTGNMPLANIATLEPSTGPAQIARYNRQRQVLMLANIAPPQSLSNVLDILNKTIEDLKMPPEYRTGTVGRTKEFGRAGKAYLFAFLLSIVLMYMVLAAQFESFIDPVTILLSLPLSVPFALLSLMFARENFSIIYSSVGILVLFGIVKKNSILQIDHIKSLRREGYDRATAIMKGCEDRLRPILMTTAALVAGMIPLAVGGGAGSGSRRTVAIAVIGGQSLCLLLTLLVTPVAYSLFDDLAALLGRAFSRIGPRTVPATMLCLLLAAPMFGQPARVGVTVTERKLGLGEAMEMALRSNLDLEIERTNIAAAGSLAKAARGAFDGVFRYAPNYENRNTPTSSVLFGANGSLKETFNNHTFSYLQRLEWKGTSLHADFDNSRQSTSNPFVGLNPLTSSRLVFGVTHPLWRGRETDRDRSEIQVRAKNIDLSKLELELRVVDTVTRVELAYWDLVAARQNVTVAADGVTWAQEQLSRTRRAIDAGTVARVELAAAEAEFERRRDTHLATLAALTEAENALKLLVVASRSDDLWSDQIVPTDERTVDTAASDDLSQAVKLALDKRPEFRGIALRAENNQTQRKLAADQAKPRIDVSANYAVAGLAGSQPLSSASNPFSQSNVITFQRLNELSARAGLPPVVAPSFSGGIPGSLVGGYGTTLSNLFGWNYQTVQAGLSMDFNHRNTAAKSAMEQAVITDRRLKLERERLEQSIAAEVRNAMQALATARQRIVAADASARAAKEKLDSETRLFNTGESTNFFVLTRQNEHLDSMRRAVLARLDFNRAVARLLRATGTTLEARQLAVR